MILIFCVYFYLFMALIKQAYLCLFEKFDVALGPTKKMK